MTGLSGAIAGADAATPVISVRNLNVAYASHQVLHDISFDLHPGTLTGLIGPNGAGKSTLIKAILDGVPATGRVSIGGSSRERRDLRSIAYVPQRASVDFTFPVTVADTAVQGTYAHLPFWGRPGHSEHAWAMECLDKVGMAHAADKPIGHLSGGQASRVFLARALPQRATIFLLDEPFVGIDAGSEAMILEVLREQRCGGAAILLVHHNLQQVPDYVDDVLVLNRRLLAAGPVAQVLTAGVLASAFPDAYALAGLAAQVDAGAETS